MSTTPRLTLSEAPSAAETPKLRSWQNATILLLLLGYAGYYFCRADLSVATPLLLKEFGPIGLDKKALGGLIALATACYAFGKFVNGSLADYLGGRRMFLIGMAGAILANIAFAFSGTIPLFTLAWALNRLIQSTGWVGMVKITGKWFSYSRYGAAMGLISLSYFFGDFTSRAILGQLVTDGFGWRQIFFVAAGVLAVLLAANFLFLKETPREVGESEQHASPENVYGAAGDQTAQTGFGDLLRPLLQNPTFWVVCALSFGFTMVRETFQDWSPDYLTEAAKMEPGLAAKVSSLFPLFGGISTLACGFGSDRLGRAGRAVLILVGLILAVPGLVALAYQPFGHSALAAGTMIALTAIVILGPYSFLAGALALDFGGKRGSSTAAGWIDGIGYLGGILSGKWIGALAQDHGWTTAFNALAGIIALTGIAALIYWRHQILAAGREAR